MNTNERVARAMFQDDHDEPWERGELATRKIYATNARTAIAEHKAALADEGLVIAPREPPEAMIEAGSIDFPRAPGEMWQAMINALPHE